MKSPSILRLHSWDFLPTTSRVRSDVCTSDSDARDQKSVVIALGSFDGLHIGHQEILSSLRQSATAQSASSVLVTFYPHPSVALGKAKELARISSLEDRLGVLRQYDIDCIAPVYFSEQIQKLEWQQFLDLLMNQIFSSRGLVIGADARIGYRAEGTADKIKKYCLDRNIPCEVLPLKCSIDGIKFASRAIRTQIEEANFLEAAQQLGRPYILRGRVIRGQQKGTTLGFPTANIATKNFILPHNGVYAAWVYIEDEKQRWPAAVNIGVRPTVVLQGDKTVEAHLIGYSGDLYGKKIGVEFVSSIRDERKFTSIAELRTQIATDIKIVTEKLTL